jgi:hypothetical protein
MALEAESRHLVDEPFACVATRALGLFVFAQQRCPGLSVVIEVDFFPVFLDVACFALRSNAAFVLVVLLVTRNTGRL